MQRRHRFLHCRWVCGVLRCSRVWNVTQTSLIGAGVWILRFDSGSGAVEELQLASSARQGFEQRLSKCCWCHWAALRTSAGCLQDGEPTTFWSSRVKRGVITRRLRNHLQRSITFPEISSFNPPFTLKESTSVWSGPRNHSILIHVRKNIFL